VHLEEKRGVLSPPTARDRDVVVVTGATSGIGEACCHRFLEAGTKVVAIGRRAERLKRLADQYGEPMLTRTIDVRDHAQVVAALDDLPLSHQSITVLINNAGLALGSASFLEGDYQKWSTMIDTNIKGMLAVTERVLPGMITRNHGHVFNIGSIGGRYPAGSTVYGSTKAFVHHFSLALRHDLLGTLVRVTVVNPGSTATEFSNIRLGTPATDVPAGGTPTMMSPSDIAEAIFLCHRLPSFVNVSQIELTPVKQVSPSARKVDSRAAP
jgi:3-hydroxy acid dehydrogenase / malonic semialdehyde reductase